MTFDWFRRRHDNQEPKPAAPAEQPSQSESEPETVAPAEDQLKWAKIAYENIRKRQQEAAQAETAPAIAEPADIKEDSPEIVQPDSDLPPQLADEPVESSPIAESEPVESTLITELEPVGEVAAPVSAPTLVETAPDPAPSLPFWAAAEADRQARLEKLRETAIPSESVPPTLPIPSTPSPISSTLTPSTDLTLDEGFIWSAEILASQGRSPDDISIEEITWLNKLRQGLDKTRRGLINQLRAIVGQGPLTQDAVIEIESALLQADVGVAATDAIIAALQQRLKAEVLPPDAAITYLKEILRDMLDRPLGNTVSAAFAPKPDTLNIWLMTGVNGAGKTTTIGKLAHIAQKSGYKCLIGAADTFRAAAVEQVKVWGARSGVEVIANPGKNTDPAAVVFDAITAAQSRGSDLLLIDTAGRLQNKKNLMDELSKVRRIIDKKAPDATVESLLVLDATLGQNGLRQAEVFSEAAKLSGVVLTKLDGTAKGGIALAIVQQLGLPIRFIGAGEGIEDLRPFSSYEFVEALLNG
ncbi:signal recognition particle-docking protein FtsY [Phormidium sp. CLA17]|uniref:signal recognition particle-docking protein FtsY n=1 Tax=Leptolyngbya sp. Cla-17 TaxID=2803751 RepID=UPI001491887A|nr:signal recognition particle-docking protein FtsY [Leptolyngbya sp. Cla-17]MBM0741191.1 signal recognition particle-docking protein FtsY [Leptolyngbya sp. Cla-17]